MVQEVLEGPWAAWEAVEETEEASPQEGLGVQEGTPLVEEMSNTELETGSVPTRMYFFQQIDTKLVLSSPHSHSGTGLWGVGLTEQAGCFWGALLPELQILAPCS